MTMELDFDQDIQCKIGDLKIFFPEDEKGVTDEIRLIEWSGLIFSRSLEVRSNDKCCRVFCHQASNYPHKKEIVNILGEFEGKISFYYSSKYASVTIDLTKNGIKPLTGYNVEWYEANLSQIKSFVPKIIESANAVYKMLVNDSRTAFNKDEIQDNLISLYTILKYPKSPASFLAFIRNLDILKHHIRDDQFTYWYDFINNYGLNKLITLSSRMSDSEIKKAVSKKAVETFFNKKSIYEVHKE